MQKLICKVKLWEKQGEVDDKQQTLSIQLLLLCSRSLTDDPHWTRGHCGCYPPPCLQTSTGRAPRHCRAAHVHTPDSIRSQVCEFSFVGNASHICTRGFQVSPYTFAGAGFHYEANKGRAVSPEITQALTEQQWPLKISAGHSGKSRTLTCHS